MSCYHSCFEMRFLAFLVWICGLRSTLGGVIKDHVDQHTGQDYYCHHEPEKKVVFDVNLEKEQHHVIRKRSVSQPLRIHLYYDDSLRNLPSAHRQLVQKLVREAVDYWQRTLLVRPTYAPIRLNRQCSSDAVRYRKDSGYTSRYCVDGCARVTKCGDIYIPPQHLERCYFWDSRTGLWKSEIAAGPGVADTDFILYVATQSTNRCTKARTIAYAAHCQQEAALDRPVAGYFTICPESISVKKHDHLQLLATLKHEILHALGFTAGLYAFYYDSNGNPLTPRNSISNKPIYNHRLNLYQWSTNVVAPVIRRNWKVRGGSTTKHIKVMITPKVVAEVRRHFGCPSLEGAELEDQGIVGTAITHWEKRIFENEAMTGTYTQNPVISRITLAMMEDTGWYKSRYENADELEWGKNLGCDFVKKSCLDWIEINTARRGDIHPFCDNVRGKMLKTDCTRNRDSVAFCNLVQYNQTLPEQYQYFSYLSGVPSSAVGMFAGSVALADYCPYLQEFAWRNGEVTVRDSRCSFPANNLGSSVNYFGEKYGHNSRCFQHGQKWKLEQCLSTLSLSHWGSGCYQYECSATQGLIIHVADRSYQCLKAGQNLIITYVSNHYLHRGSIVCPSCAEMCQSPHFTCPADRQPYNVVNAPHDLTVPCRGSALCSQTFFVHTWCFLVLVYFHFKFLSTR